MSAPPLRRLFFDIETSPNLVFSWRAGYKLAISHESIVQERKIITCAWKWAGKDEPVRDLAWDKDQDDAALLRRFLPIINSADEVVAHFGARFDVPWFRTRCLIQGIGPVPIYKVVDTKAMAATFFYFNSNKLDYLAQLLGLGAKLKTDYDLWKDIVLHRDAAALRRMRDYNRQDVLLLEKVYDKLATFTPPRSHVGVMYGLEKWSCPRCATDKVVKVRRYTTAKGIVQQQMKCKGCGGYYNISEAAARKYEEARAVKA